MPALTLKITLQDVEPIVSRKIVVSSESSMYLLQYIIQLAMGWKNMHLYHFTANNINIGDLRLLLNEEEESEANLAEAKEFMVDEILTETGQTITYYYDYSDYWENKIELIGIDNKPLFLALPALIEGENI